VKDLECNLGEKIIVWKKEVVKECPYQQVVLLKNATLNGNQVVDNVNNHMFIIKDKQGVCNMTLYETTTGLLINTDKPNAKLAFSDISIRGKIRIN